MTKSCSCGPGYGQAQIQYPDTPYGAGVFTSAQGGQTKNHNVNKSYAAYTDGSYHVTDKLQFNAGFRVTYDDITASIATVPVAGVYNSATTINGGVVLVPGYINGTFYNTGATGNFVIPALVNTSETRQWWPCPSASWRPTTPATPTASARSTSSPRTSSSTPPSPTATKAR